MLMIGRTLCFTMLIGALIPAARAQSSVFRIQPTPNARPSDILTSVSALSSTDAWAVGGEVLHWDGMKWNSVPAPLPNNVNEQATLNGVAAIAGNDVWAAGEFDDFTTGSVHALMEHWDGTAWSSVNIPRPGISSLLSGITAFSANDIWASGFFQTSGALLPLFEHWDGTAWKVVPTSLRAGDFIIRKISGSSPTDIWAVWDDESTGVVRPVAMHWDGARWTLMNPPARGGGDNPLYDVLALAPDDVWAVGAFTPQPQPTSLPTLTLIEHWDGTSWQIVPSPNFGPLSIYQSNRLFGITALSPADIWACGSFFAANGSNNQRTLALHWDGTSWTIKPTPNTGNSDTLFGGATMAPGTVWLVGGFLGGPRFISSLVLSASGL